MLRVDKRGLGKKGVESGPLSSIAGLIIIGIFVVVVILAIYFLVGQGEVIGELTPEEVDLLGKACSGYLQARFDVSYCTFKPLSNDQYANCEHPKVQEYLNKIKAEQELGTFPSCDANGKAAECNRIKEEKGQDGFDKFIVNGDKCSEILKNPEEKNTEISGGPGEVPNNPAEETGTA